MRVDLDGLEAALRKHPLVRDAGALARTSNADEEMMLVAYVSARDEAPANLDDLKELCARRRRPCGRRAFTSPAMFPGCPIRN
jgi:hypothetical protein